ncbi:phage head closure protein [Lactococcus lactis]|jgi:SPP1 family predicted phage head-tail adaptor|uniref:phage head closure protein n=1 Tax=Lactococcus lactis TaxID=1358 RepID=UPI001F0D5E89|nr:phage head closure protein [Lactococcus lactis]UMU18443.1 head-tail adaptor protein [Lactococcus lactis subsp. lactis]DAG08664.1 MAG TPA: Putative head tail adaptor [Caudoviricetes sp.]
MYAPHSFIIQKFESDGDGIGGVVKTWKDFITVKGYLDLVNGTNQATLQNAIVEESTHILIIPKYVSGITDKMRVIDEEGKVYSITYPDNPMGLNHHNEIYLIFGGKNGN